MRKLFPNFEKWRQLWICCLLELISAFLLCDEWIYIKATELDVTKISILVHLKVTILCGSFLSCFTCSFTSHLCKTRNISSHGYSSDAWLCCSWVDLTNALTMLGVKSMHAYLIHWSFCCFLSLFCLPALFPQLKGCVYMSKTNSNGIQLSNQFITAKFIKKCPTSCGLGFWGCHHIPAPW